ncbi:MAG: hypothetical protein ISS94_03355, partial [Candidatus Syntrophoarchaeum sp.]|nr:hypothetical protein [Candidatus Syntrophoarchaeum sp.]
MFNKEELEQAVWNAIRKTINKFREQPYYFFTESDIHSYFYYSLYSTKFEVVREDKRIYCIHREYPTNFRYRKGDLLKPEYTEPYPLSKKIGDRGHFDIAVLNPEFIFNAPSCEDIVNKNVRFLEERVEDNLESVKNELLFAIEFKYIIKNNKNFINEILKDNKKLLFAKRWGSKEAVNLVFCNIDDSYVIKVKEAILNASGDIHAIFIQSYYKNNKKVTPKIEANKID